MRQRIRALLLIAVLIAADQLTKLIATHSWQKAPLVILNGVLELTYTQNTGAAWGMFAGGRWILVAVTAVIVLAAIVLLMSGRLRHPLSWISAALLVAGGV
ncbi:MAG: signal peptidase II, partial [Clostridia bacterium]|nr:signal peptidase II [Clostridia bacterium]